MVERLPPSISFMSRFYNQAQHLGILPGCGRINIDFQRPRIHATSPFNPCNRQQNRALHRYRKPTGQDPNDVSPFADPNSPLDENIQSRLVHLVSPDGQFQRNKILSSLISRADSQTKRRERHVRQVDVDSENVPIVKIVSRKELQESAQLYSKVLSRNKVGGESLKELELSWNIDRGDLPHRLRKIQDWLRQGKNVEVSFFPKRRGVQAREFEAQELVDRIGTAANDVGATLEGNEVEGKLGGDATLRFKPSDETDGRSKVQILKQSREDKKKQKEEEKKAWKAELEERKKRKERAKQR